MGKAAAKRPAAKGRARAKGKRRPSGEPKCPNCRRGCWVGGCWEVAAGGCCWSVSLPALSGRRTSRNCVRKGAVRCHPLCVPVPSFPPSLVPAGWSRCGRRQKGWSGRGRANWNVGPYAWGATRRGGRRRGRFGYCANPPLKSRFYPVITRLTTQLRYNRNSITCVLKLWYLSSDFMMIKLDYVIYDVY